MWNMRSGKSDHFRRLSCKMHDFFPSPANKWIEQKLAASGEKSQFFVCSALGQGAGIGKTCAASMKEQEGIAMANEKKRFVHMR